MFKKPRMFTYDWMKSGGGQATRSKTPLLIQVFSVGQEIEESCRYIAPDRHPLILLKGKVKFPDFKWTVCALERYRELAKLSEKFNGIESSHVTLS
jgi:hypothetical protein